MVRNLVSSVIPAENILSLHCRSRWRSRHNSGLCSHGLLGFSNFIVGELGCMSTDLQEEVIGVTVAAGGAFDSLYLVVDALDCVLAARDRKKGQGLVNVFFTAFGNSDDPVERGRRQSDDAVCVHRQPEQDGVDV